MRSRSFFRLAAPAAVLTLGACLLAAPAQASTTEVADAVSAVASVAPTAAAPAGLSVEGQGSALQGQAGAVAVALPTDPLDGVNIDSGVDVTIGLPFADEASRAAVADASTLVIDNNNGSSSVPSVHEDGSLRIATVIDSASAPTRYDYPVTLPSDGTLVATEDGGAAIVLADGTELGRFAAPWAFQADGTPVATAYEISGTTLTQVVSLDASMAFPVVADPTYTTYTSYWSRTQVENMYRTKGNIDQFCRFAPTSYVAGVGCAVTPSLDQALTQAHFQSKRIKAVFYNCAATYCNYYKYYVVA